MKEAEFDRIASAIVATVLLKKDIMKRIGADQLQPVTLLKGQLKPSCGEQLYVISEKALEELIYDAYCLGTKDRQVLRDSTKKPKGGNPANTSSTDGHETPQWW